jgi:hypothetical protein
MRNGSIAGLAPLFSRYFDVVCDENSRLTFLDFSMFMGEGLDFG